jgi:hypothetical protein
MKKSLLFILFIFISLGLKAQKDTLGIAPGATGKSALAEASQASLRIYPVPVRENFFNINSDKPISALKVTNIIGQDIFKVKYNNPEKIIRIILDNPKRGMYLVTISLEDGTRIVKKIMIEQAE